MPGHRRPRPQRVRPRHCEPLPQRAGPRHRRPLAAAGWTTQPPPLAAAGWAAPPPPFGRNRPGRATAALGCSGPEHATPPPSAAAGWAAPLPPFCNGLGRSMAPPFGRSEPGRAPPPFGSRRLGLDTAALRSKRVVGPPTASLGSIGLLGRTNAALSRLGGMLGCATAALGPSGPDHATAPPSAERAGRANADLWPQRARPRQAAALRSQRAAGPPTAALGRAP